MPLKRPSELKTSNNHISKPAASAAGPIAGPGIRAMFDRIASDYDRFNSWASLGLHQRWRRALLSHVPLRSRVLDIATGTGDVALMAAYAGHSVVGLDFSERMLAIARQKASLLKDLPADRPIRWMNGSADRLPFSDRSFECVTSAFALRNLRGCLEAVFRENLRVLRPGGKVLHMDFGRPRSPLSRFGHQMHLNFGIPLLGQWICGERWPKGYLEKTIQDFYEPRDLMALLQQAGFSDVKAIPLAMGAVMIYEGTKPC